MKELEKEFIGKGQVKGFKFTQLKQNERAFLYKVDTGSTIHYEIFKRKVNKRFGCVSYPSNKAFGLWATTKKNLDTAINYFNTL